MPIQRSFALIVTLALTLAAMVPLVAPASTRAVSPNIVISQVYGGGGNSGATLTHDFIELFNRGPEAVDVTGWSVQYAASAGTTWQVTTLSGTIQPGRYFLVQEAKGSGGTAGLPTPDASGTIAMSATSGKVALSSSSTELTGSCPAVVDFVGFGSADCFEGTGATPALSNTTAAVRATAGCQDTDDNAGDFATGQPAPRNSASAVTSCDPNQTTNPGGSGTSDPSQVRPGEMTELSVAVTPGTNPDSTDLTVTADLTAIGGSDAQTFTSTDGVTFTFAATVAATTAPGMRSIPVSITDAQGRSGSTTIELLVVSNAGGNVVISQVYGGGGNANATYTHDFVELYNRSDASVNLSGWSVQYGSASGSTWSVAPLVGSIDAGGHYLVQLASTAAVGAPLPTPDATGSLNLSGASGKVALSSGTAPLTTACPSVATFVDLVGYGSANCFEGSGATGALTSTTAAVRLLDGAQDTNDNRADFGVAAPNPRNSGITQPDPCVEDATLISAVQGSGMTSPMAGQTVTVQGVVVGDFQNNDSPDDGSLGIFFIQEEDADADADPMTSEGIAVFSSTDVAVGQLVRVTGRVVEFPDNSDSQITELTSVSSIHVCDEDADLPTATVINLPVTDPAAFEQYEGMLVTFPQTLTISEFFNFDRFGEIVLTVDRDHQPTAVHEPGSTEAEALAEENRLNRILLDDGISTQNPPFTRHPNGEEFTLENRFRGGDTLTNVTGVMDHSFGLYRVQPTEGADYTAVNLRPAAPDDVGGTLTVASFNVLNYFTTLTSAGNVCGPLENQECRGADTAEELERQQAKIVAALATMDADVVGLIEIENHVADVPTATLVEALNSKVGSGTYDYVETGGIGTDVIRVAFIYKPATVTPVGELAILDSTVDPRFNDEHNRPVLAQAFEENATGGVVTVAVNHLKSKGSGCGGPPDDDPVQGNCNLTREAAAEALVDWLATDPTDSGDLDALIIGDLNSYDKEDPIDAIREAGYTDLVHRYEGELAYSYLFDGQLGYLDHALSSPTLTSQVTGATVWHINADEPDILDYDMSFKKDPQDALWEANAYRSSDHDPVIVGLDLLAYGFDGLEPPIDEENTARAGSTVPVRFSLGADVDVDDVLFESMQVYTCGEWPSGASEDAVGAGSTGFRYDPADDQYVFNWKTDREWAGECKALVVTLQDGTYAIAEFDFR